MLLITVMPPPSASPPFLLHVSRKETPLKGMQRDGLESVVGERRLLSVWKKVEKIPNQGVNLGTQCSQGFLQAAHARLVSLLCRVGTDKAALTAIRNKLSISCGQEKRGSDKRWCTLITPRNCLYSCCEFKIR